MFASLFVVVVGLCYCGTEGTELFLGRPRLYGPSEGLVNKVTTLTCELLSYPKNERVLLQLFKKGNRNKTLGHNTLLGEKETFPLVVKLSYEGNLECSATLQNNSRSIEATVSDPHYLKVVVPVQGAETEVLTESLEFFEGKTLKLRCKVKAGNYVSYKWFLNDWPISQSHFHIQFGNELWVYRTTNKDSGSYRCEATNHFNNTAFTSNASEVVISVKDVASVPDVSFVVLKEDSRNYSAVVTCQSTKGTGPITFSLYNSSGRQAEDELIGNKTSQDRKATFKVPLVLGRHMGWLQCRADNGDWPAHSQWLPLEVVPVGKPVKIRYEYFTGDNYAVVHLIFYCKVAKGSHPRYKWFLNNTLLRGRGSFYNIVNRPSGESMLLLTVGTRSAGTYHCDASDSFDNNTSISSTKQYMDKEVLNRLPVLVVAVVFGCFVFLILLLSICCWIGVVYRRRLFGETSLLGMEMKKNIIMYEGELDLLDGSEDGDVGQTASGDESDQASEPSVDEWLQLTEEKKTLEDGPIEFP